MVKLVYTGDLKSPGPNRPCRFKSGLGHHLSVKTVLAPFSNQAIELFEQLQSIFGHYPLIFPLEKRREECMSDNTMRRAIFRLGYDGSEPGKNKCTPHGFRANATSILSEAGFNPDTVERQMAHVGRNKVRAAYILRARYLDEASQEPIDSQGIWPGALRFLQLYVRH